MAMLRKQVKRLQQQLEAAHQQADAEQQNLQEQLEAERQQVNAISTQLEQERHDKEQLLAYLQAQGIELERFNQS